MPIDPQDAPAAMARLLDIMARLRDPKSGCPWDLAQSFATIAPHTIEEAYEVAEAIRAGDMTALADELGDLLFQVVFYAQMAREAGHFSFSDVAAGIAEKMERRHPHVFGSAEIADAAAQTRAWEDQKARERAAAAGGRSPSALDGVLTSLPGLTRALKLQRRAARVGFDWPETAGILEKIDEELGEIREAIAAGSEPDRIEDEIGDLLFSCVNLARRLEAEPESALRRTNAKFEARFRHMEASFEAMGRRLESQGHEVLETAWHAAKHASDSSKA